MAHMKDDNSVDQSHCCEFWPIASRDIYQQQSPAYRLEGSHAIIPLKITVSGQIHTETGYVLFFIYTQHAEKRYETNWLARQRM